MLWEPLGDARTHLPEWDDMDRHAVVERLLRELYAAALISFYREVRDAEDADVVEEPLTSDKVDAALRATGWRSVPVGRDGIDIWIAATERGVKAVDDPPAHIRKLWNLPERTGS